ncbi:MAG: hypothetical protein QM535_05665, partial [Limnohabitans sp.]|nr:hypothetical protein [Limnohabitans sp.]
WKSDIQIEKMTLKMSITEMFNGESEVLIDDSLKNDKEKPRGLPSYLYFNWQNKEKKKKAVDIDVDEQKLFQAISKIDKSIAFQLIFRHNAQKTGLYIIQKDQEFLVQDIPRTKVYDSRL